ncbi:Cytochrome P450 [Popillia japonica]|uniref:Cytochrome P450 n=1 Tax=Popillia japonica TaxID=7064 RepID=A0AAW1LA82_POPJA
MVLLELTTLIVVVLSLGYYYVKRSQRYWANRNAPHLPVKSFWGNMENPITTKKGLKFDLKNAHDELKRLGYKHGGISLFTQPVYLAVDPEVCKLILTKDFQYFGGRGGDIDYERNPLAGHERNPLAGHLFNLDGEKWRNLRVKLTPTFTSGKMKLMFDTLLSSGIPMLDRIGEFARENKAIDIKETVGCYTTDVIGSCAFGVECNSFKDPNSDFRRNGRKIFSPRLAFTLAQFLRFIAPPLMRAINLKIIPQDIEDFFIGAVKSVIHHRNVNQVQRNDFLQILLNLQEQFKKDGKNQMNLEEFSAQCFVFFVAGFETSSTTLTFCLHELAFNQDVQDKLRNEIREAMQNNDGKLTYDSVMGMKYLDGVVNETLRKYPPVPALFRKCDRDYTLTNTNTTLQAGIQVFISVLGLHYDEEYYPDPEKFIPERFMEENKHNRPQYTHLPFGEGPRNCIGARFGLMQTKTALAMILDKFKVLPGPEETYKVNYDPKVLIMTKKGELTLKAEILG